MLVRLVTMTFDPSTADAFLSIFDASAPRIHAFPGCLHLELWRDDRFPNVMTTHSRWTDEAALEAYRSSDLFRSTWSQTKRLFAAAPTARSYYPLRNLAQ